MMKRGLTTVAVLTAEARRPTDIGRTDLPLHLRPPRPPAPGLERAVARHSLVAVAVVHEAFVAAIVFDVARDGEVEDRAGSDRAWMNSHAGSLRRPCGARKQTPGRCQLVSAAPASADASPRSVASNDDVVEVDADATGPGGVERAEAQLAASECRCRERSARALDLAVRARLGPHASMRRERGARRRARARRCRRRRRTPRTCRPRSVRAPRAHGLRPIPVPASGRRGPTFDAGAARLVEG